MQSISVNSSENSYRFDSWQRSGTLLDFIYTKKKKKHIHVFDLPFYFSKFYVFESRFILPIFLIAITFLWIPAAIRGRKAPTHTQTQTHTEIIKWPVPNSILLEPCFNSIRFISFIHLITTAYKQSTCTCREIETRALIFGLRKVQTRNRIMIKYKIISFRYCVCVCVIVSVLFHRCRFNSKYSSEKKTCLSTTRAVP